MQKQAPTWRIDDPRLVDIVLAAMQDRWPQSAQSPATSRPADGDQSSMQSQMFTQASV